MHNLLSIWISKDPMVFKVYWKVKLNNSDITGCREQALSEMSDFWPINFHLFCINEWIVAVHYEQCIHVQLFTFFMCLKQYFLK